MGSPDFAVASLKALHASHHQIAAVVTQPDRPFGRRLHLHAPAIKTAALSLGLPIFQPETTRDPAFLQQIQAFQPQMLVVVAYGEILRPSLLEIPEFGAINLHASLLPKYRGAAPVAWAILNGETETGVTTMQINNKMDAGDIYLQSTIPIESTDTTTILTERLGILGAPLLRETADRIETGTIQPVPQDATRATLAPKLKKEQGHVDWNHPADRISRQTRAFDPWPGTFSTLNNVQIKIWMAISAAESTTAAPGTIVSAGSTLDVACGGGTLLRIVELQPENRPRMKAVDFIHGAHLQNGARFVQI